MITVYGRANSSNVQAVMWGIAEIGVPYERLDYGHVHGGLDDPDFRAINPHGLVPALRDGDLTMFESSAILRYLAARYGDGGAFWPTDPVERATVDKWAEWGKTSFCRDFTAPIFWLRVRTAARDRDEAELAANIAIFETRLDRLQDQLARHDHAAGPDFSLADIVIGHVLYRWFDIDVPRQPRPLVEAYYDRLTRRPAYRDHVMLSYDALKADGA